MLTISLHQDGLYPAESGLVEHTGKGPGEGACVNVPLPPAPATAPTWRRSSASSSPPVEAFEPDLLVIASGLDASMMDPLAMQVVTSEGYREMTDFAVDLAARACDGRLALIHEGGYPSSCVPFCGAALPKAAPAR